MADNPRQKLCDLLDDIKVGMLTTIDESGQLHSRPMWAVEVADDANEIWFFTRASSHKVADINGEHRVNLAFAEPKRQEYVSIAGTARLVRDPARNKALWKEPFRTWFPDGLDDPDLALLQVTPTSAQYWDSPSSAMVHLFGYIKAITTGQIPQAGDNQKITIA